MRILKLEETGAAAAAAEAVSTLTAGGIVCFPTETFYALGIRYDDPAARLKLYMLKQRDERLSLPLIIGSTAVLKSIAPDISNQESRLMERFWPGPLTLLLKAGAEAEPFGKRGFIAVRIPGSSFALDLARASGFPITATSANISGMPPADSAEDVINYFGDAPDLLINGGTTPGGKPSTIARVKNGMVTILREGAVSREELDAALKQDLHLPT